MILRRPWGHLKKNENYRIVANVSIESKIDAICRCILLRLFTFLFWLRLIWCVFRMIYFCGCFLSCCCTPLIVIPVPIMSFLSFCPWICCCTCTCCSVAVWLWWLLTFAIDTIILFHYSLVPSYVTKVSFSKHYHVDDNYESNFAMIKLQYKVFVVERSLLELRWQIHILLSRCAVTFPAKSLHKYYDILSRLSD